MSLAGGGQADRQPLGVRIRGGLTSQEMWTRGGRVWILSDPMVRQYYYLFDEEYELLRMLDGRASVGSIRDRFESGHARRRLDGAQLRALIASWHREGLVESLSAGQAELLFHRHTTARHRRRWQALQNPLAVRLPGFDPTWMLNRLEPAVRWMFSPLAVLAGIGLVIAALLMVMTQFSTLTSQLPSLESLATPEHLTVILLTTVVVKILHELGHAVACRHFGAETKELGVLLLLLMPCLYCDVSDAWRLPRRRDRLLISAAGLIVEIVIAALATILWWFTQPGLLHTVCMSVMLLGSFNTLLVNGNPLLRYDGYYLLADGLGILNLWSRSRRVVAEFMGRVLFGVEPREGSLEDQGVGRFLLLYGLASIAYRWLVLGLMLVFLYRLLIPLGLEAVAVIAAGWLAWFSLIVPIFGWFSHMSQPAVRRRWRSRRVGISLAFGGLLVLMFVAIPVPNWMTVAAMLQPAEASEVYVSVPGRLVKIERPIGSAAESQEVIARLVNRDLAVERLRLEGELQRAESRLEHVEARGATDPAARSQVPTARAHRDDRRRQLEQLVEDLRRLDLVAPRGGTILPVTPVVPRAADGELEEWSGQALDEQNLGAFLETGTHLCSVGPPSRWQAVLYVEQDQMEYLNVGLPVRLRLEHLPGEVLDGRVATLAKVNAESIPPQLSGRAPAASIHQAALAAPSRRVYQVRVTIEGEPQAMLVDAPGEAVIWMPHQTLLALLQRFISETFTF